MPKIDESELLGFHNFVDEEDGEAFGSFLVFKYTEDCPWPGSGEPPAEHGYYWQACEPGEKPNTDACGPFLTARGAYKDAQE